ncbi:RNA-binding domain-containing protein [Sedimentibacter sp. B4]|uniref:RNA-binding domain-containing protein n=1 Tax=Sedimentibacter sp. B4 TaxID=304766 RepID=UPI0002FEB079|nr:RNA-binding domain-containing protein [Sedimentibacter sp. B4]
MNLFENENTEFKREYVAGINKTVVAFANSKGGTIYIGVSDDGEIIGIEDTDTTLLNILNTIRDSIRPDVSIYTSSTIKNIERKKIIEINVQRGINRPYYITEKGLKPSGVYVRQGNASVPASEELIRQMIKETNGDKFEEVRSFNQELTFEYAHSEFKSNNLNFNHSQMKTLGIQDYDGLYTNLGLLLSEQCTHNIKVASFDGKDKNIFNDRREFAGSLLKQLSDAYEYIDLFNKTRATYSGLTRMDKRDYPPEAIREALINSIVHREYSFSGSTLINIFDDRIEFISLGGLVPGLALEDIMIGVSQCRNEKLANVFYRLKLIEAYGTGISKIIASYNGSINKPVIKATYGAFKVVLPNLNYTQNEMVKEEIENYVSNPQYNTILNYINSNGSITRNEVQEILNVGQTRAINVLKEMAGKELIKTVGKGKRTMYVK